MREHAASRLGVGDGRSKWWAIKIASLSSNLLIQCMLKTKTCLDMTMGVCRLCKLNRLMHHINFQVNGDAGSSTVVEVTFSPRQLEAYSCVQLGALR